jgi:adhesin transport system outer membrane protein
MNKIFSVMIFISLLSPLFAIEQAINKEYMIMLGACKQKSNADTINNKFPESNTKIMIKKGKKKSMYYAVMNQIKSKKEAIAQLKVVKKKIKDAYIISKVSNTKDTSTIKKNIVKTIPKKVTTPIENNQTKKSTKTLKKVLKKEKTAPLKIVTKEKGILLKDAILKALNRSYKILAGREKVIQAKRKVDEKRSAYKPTVNFNANVGAIYLHPVQAKDEKFLKGDESIVINQNLYAGGKHSNEIKKETANLQVAQEKFKSQVEEETLKIIDAYLSLIYQKRGIKITRDNMITLQKILDIVTIKEESGAATKGDLNYIKSQVENASAALVKAESKYQNAIAFYEYYVGKLDESNNPIEYEFSFPLEDKKSTIAMMYKNNAKIQIAYAKMQSEIYNLQAQKSKFKPTLDLSITGKDKQSGYEAEPHEDRATALLSLNYNLYNGGKDKAVILGTKSKIEELEYKLIDLKESSEYNTKQMYENILSSRDALKHTQKEVEANLKVTNSYWAAFKYGTQDIQALLLAQRALNRSQLDVVKEKQTYTNGYFKLMEQTGTLLKTLALKDFIDAKKMVQNKHINYFY